jgi:hypothetical protein
MKKIITTLLLVSFFSFTKAQLKIKDPATNADVLSSYYVQVNPGSATQSFDFEIHNDYSTSKTIKVKRYILQHSVGQDIYYCFGSNCYTANSNPVFIPNQNVTIPSGGMLPNGAGTYGLKTDFDDNSILGSSVVRYTMYDVNNISDSISFVVTYDVAAIGIKKNEEIGYKLNFCSPNPASNFVNIPYELKQTASNAKIVLHNIIGNKVKEIEINELKGIAQLDLSQLEEGIYFYSLQINQKLVSTKKLILER